MIRTLAALAAYVGAIVAANYLTARFGLVPIGFDLMATAGTIAAGLSFLARDIVQDTAGRLAVFGAILAGGLLSWWLSSPQLALASVAAFLVSEAADMAVYTPLRDRGWARAVLASNAVGAVVDTLLFLALAGFPVNGATVGGQLVGKIAWATILPVAAVLVVRRVVSREPLNAEGA